MINKILIFCFIFTLKGCQRIQEDIEITDEVLQEEEKIYNRIKEITK